MSKGKENKVRGINITVSPKAHEKMSKEAFNAKPKKKNLREHINIMNNLPLEA